MTPYRRLAPALAAALVCACGTPEQPPPAEGQAAAPDRPEGNFSGRVYERNFVFTTVGADTAIVVPWLFTSRTRPGGVDRRARGLLARGVTWEPFYAEAWETPPSRAPWRLLPNLSLRLVVGEGDAISGVLFEEGPRALDMEFEDVLIEWTGGRGQTFRLVSGAVYLSERRVEGVVLDMTRVVGADQPPPGDWAFLVSGDSLAVVLESERDSAPGEEGAWGGWGRLDFRSLRWPALTVEWAEVSAYQPARRDVPVSWSLTSGDADLEGSLRVGSAEIRAGEGSGPVLPVDALFGVEGTLVIEGGAYPVRGLVRHGRS